MSLSIKIMMERPSQFTVQARIAHSSSLAAALHFTRAMKEAKEDLVQILGVDGNT